MVTKNFESLGPGSINKVFQGENQMERVGGREPERGVPT
jgi:hypothetical protein